MIKLFSGTANKPLSDKIAALINIPIAQSEIVRFENSEIRIRIEEDVRYKTCVLLQSTSNPTDTHLMELFFFCDALRRQEAQKVIGVIPYFGYARQDIQHRPGECISANVIIKFLESIGFYKVYTINLHDEATEGVFSIPFKNMDAFPLLAREIQTYLGKNTATVDQVAVVSPDHGGVERARKFSDTFFGSNRHTIAVVEKKRDLQHIHESHALDLYGDVNGKIAILVDDMTTSGKTLVNASRLCLERGAKRVLTAVVHHDFAPDITARLQDSPIEAFFTTDTILLQDDQRFNKLHEVSVAQLIADELRHLTK
ncbi:MAG: ribose-phosphate pyrophosphokinase [Patescibacteria group bacterium]